MYCESREIIDYIKSKNRRLISPIWPGEMEFHFLCLHHIDFSDALGFETYQATPVLRLVRENSVRDEAHLDEIIARRYFDYSYMDAELASLQEMLKANSTPSGGGAFGPLTIASGIFGAERMLKLAAKDPGFVKKFVDYIASFIIELAEREKAAGGQFFWIAEPLASLLSPKRFWDLSGMYLEKIFDAAGVPGFLHVCGQTIKHTDNMVRTGAQVLSIDYMTDIGECIRMVPDNIVIMGNVSPITLAEGTREDVRRECLRILDACRGYDNFIMGTGCSMIPGTDPGNMEEMFLTTENYPYP